MLLRPEKNTVIRPILFGASLTALNKKPVGMRPVAVGITFRRMAAMVMCQRIEKPITKKLAPNQLGVGIPRGAEIGAHAAYVRLILMPNTNLPSIFFFGSTFLPSTFGCQQEDPLGPAIPALVIQPIVYAIQAELNQWYLDDATIGDSLEVVLADLDVHTLSDLTISTNTEENKARLLAAQCKTSGSWLNALRSPQLRTYMSGETFRTFVAIRLGADVCQPHRCPCGAVVSAKGLYGLACKLKPPGCSRSNGKKPDRQTLVPWRRGRCLI
ncbi:hypothetical protein ILUMI_19673 [Ignelater luminosus]|uniref:Uncharacterized protein n=1 Tax=Ignelater luminosus TaxID=2038154 RepID=A0A8K0G596_IGNLU|nr:hypothetical protein ILUMI_19673 [Ignelater luminosus]